MIFDFNSKGLYEEPTILLCYPNLVEHVYLSFFKGLMITPRFNAISELTCTVYEKYMDDQTHKWVDVPCYELIKKNKVLHVLGFGYFVITQASESMDGTVNTKQVTAYSYEFTLNKKYANLEDDTYEFYDPVDNSNTLLGKLITLFPSWTIGHVDTELWPLQRTFSGVNGGKTYYQFLMTDVEEAYGCIFDFDIENMTINAYTPNNSVSETDIILSFDSTVKDITISEDTSSIKTALYVGGSGDLTINNVNPLGTSHIYDFSYYKTLEWMNQDLIDALTAWENKLASYQVTYSEKLVILKDKNAELIVLESAVETLNRELAELEKARTEQYPDIETATTNAIIAKQAEITAKQAEINSKNDEIGAVTAELTAINNEVSFASNFTELQLSQLDRLIDEDSYVNDTYEITDSMNNVEIVDLTQQLYEAGLEQLKQVSQPNYTFSMDTVNFLFIKKFLPFIQQVKMGCKIYVETDKVWYNPLLLEMVIDYDEPNNFTMTFGNRFRLMDQTWTVTELLGSVQSTTSSVKGNSSLWTNGAKAGNLFTEYKNSTLNAANQSIINSEDQTVEMGAYGLRSRKLLSDGSYDPKQWWANNGLICMTDDNWQTSKLAIGEVNGHYCVNAEVISGDLLVGGGLKIYTADGSFVVDENGAKIHSSDNSFILDENGVQIHTSDNSFILDENGAQLVNADFLMQTKETDGRIKNQILLNPDTGFKIQSNTTADTGTPVYKDIFALASNGSGIMMEGSIVTEGQLEDAISGHIFNTKVKLDSGALLFYTDNIEVGGIYALGGNINNIGITISGSNGNKVYIDNGGQITTDTLFVKNIYGVGSQYIDKAYIDEFHSNMIYTEDIHTDEIQTGHLSFDYGGYANRIESVDVVTNVTYSQSTNSISVTKKSIKCLQ